MFIFTINKICGKMPNWCACSLSIKGTEDDLKLFYDTLNTPNKEGLVVLFSFHQNVPRPSNTNWYTWNIENWGTKWDATNVSVASETPTKFLVQFDTAWSPPLSWLKTVSKKYPTMKFKLAYCESGMEFYGVVTRHDIYGEVHTSEYEFLKDDEIYDDDDTVEINVKGRLHWFMTKYSLLHTGG